MKPVFFKTPPVRPARPRPRLPTIAHPPRPPARPPALPRQGRTSIRRPLHRVIIAPPLDRRGGGWREAVRGAAPGDTGGLEFWRWLCHEGGGVGRTLSVRCAGGRLGSCGSLEEGLVICWGRCSMDMISCHEMTSYHVMTRYHLMKLYHVMT